MGGGYQSSLTIADAAESHFQTALPLLAYGRGEIIYPQAAEDNSYFKVSSDQPIMSFAVFGTRDLSAFAAIPGQ